MSLSSSGAMPMADLPVMILATDKLMGIDFALR
jgi:hypothetical protein